MASSKKVVTWYDPAFGGADLDVATLPGTVVSADELAGALPGAACLVTLHGARFPKDAWGALLDFLRGGGGLVALGGPPFRTPAFRDGDGWAFEAEQGAYLEALNILEWPEIDVAGLSTEANADWPLLAGREELFSLTSCHGLMLRGTTAQEGRDAGATGPAQIRVRPLLRALSPDGRPVASPAVLIEHVGGDFAGGRWAWVNAEVGPTFWAGGGAGDLARLADFCARGVSEVRLRPTFACYAPGERASVHVDVPRRASGVTLELHLRLRGPSGGQVWETRTGLDERGASFTLPLALEAGFYELEGHLSEDGEIRTLRQGFWCRDDALLRSGEPLTAGRDYFQRGRRPLPIVGMTYMGAEAGRKFLTQPNPSEWARDMRELAALGVNLLRTGLWTGHEALMPEDGPVREEALRALDAFVLCAGQHGLEVVFTFFAFTPPAWSAGNPYLDPRALDLQRRFVRAFAARHAATTNVHWDLINEPTVFDPARLWGGPRAHGDSVERAAFVGWLRERYANVQELQAAWGMTPAELPGFEAAAPPEPGEVDPGAYDTQPGKRGGRWLDWSLFSMDAFNGWAGALRTELRAAAPRHLVTVGQDEALGAQRPSPLFYARAVDYTTQHSWWQNDHLVWDGVFAKVWGKPCLTQETGVMYARAPWGRARRSEQEARDLLERKYATALMTGGAGAVQWIWNTNAYLNSTNESSIGALRADGSHKCEVEVTRDFGAFLGAARDLFSDRAPEDVAVVFPYSNDLGHRRLAFDATARLSRVLIDDLKTPFRALSEYDLAPLDLTPLDGTPPRLILVPSPHNFSAPARERLLEHVARVGGTLLWTGPLRLDARWRFSEGAVPALPPTRLRNVARAETLRLDGEELTFTFGGNRALEVSAEVLAGEEGAPELLSLPLGAGTLLWSPLPLELSDSPRELARVYRHALAASGAAPELTWLRGAEPGVLGRRLAFARGALLVFTSENARDVDVEVRADGAREYRFVLPAGRAALFATDHSGRVAHVYRPLAQAVRESAVT